MALQKTTQTPQQQQQQNTSHNQNIAVEHVSAYFYKMGAWNMHIALKWLLLNSGASQTRTPIEWLFQGTLQISNGQRFLYRMVFL